MVLKTFNVCLISRINLRSEKLSFLQRNHEISIFVWEKAQSQPDTVAYSFFFSSLIQTKIVQRELWVQVKIFENRMFLTKRNKKRDNVTSMKNQPLHESITITRKLNKRCHQNTNYYEIIYKSIITIKFTLNQNEHPSFITFA